MAQAPEGPRNKKNRPFGSGTTNATRRQKRQHLQWSNLGQADPTDPALLLNHLEALEKAQEELQKSLEKLSCQSHRSTLDDLEKSSKEVWKRLSTRKFGKAFLPTAMGDLEKSPKWFGQASLEKLAYLSIVSHRRH